MAIMFDGCDTPTYQMRSLVVVDQRGPSDQILYIKIRVPMILVKTGEEL